MFNIHSYTIIRVYRTFYGALKNKLFLYILSNLTPDYLELLRSNRSQYRGCCFHSEFFLGHDSFLYCLIKDADLPIFDLFA